MKTLIKGAQVVCPDEIVQVDVLIDGTQITALDPAPQSRVDQVIDAAGLALLPGVIDDQVHFREPGLTHKEDLAHATRACAKGGITSFLEMPNTNPTTTSQDRLLAKLELARQQCRVNYGFYIGATPNNIEALKQADRTCGIKIFIGSSTGELLVDDQDALEKIFAETTLPIAAHCEDESTILANQEKWSDSNDVATHSKIRDHRAAIVATRRALDLAHRHDHRFHVLHVSTADELEIIQDHRNRITAEACPHHLFFHTGDYARLGSLVQMNPSLKTADDNQAIWQGLRSGVLQVVATDHAPHTLEEKQLPYPKSPSGLPCVENLLPLMLNQAAAGHCTLLELAHWLSDAPARVWDIVNKGRISEGYDADLVLVDLNREKTVRNEEQLTKCGWSPWSGQTLRGWPVRTWVMGQEAFVDDQVVDSVRGTEVQYDHALGGYWATAPSTTGSDAGSDR